MRDARFVWRDLMTTNPEAAKTFYTQLFGWTLDGAPMPGLPNDTYDMFANRGEVLGGCMPLDPGHGTPPHWISYVEVPDSVDAAVERAAAKGGMVGVPPMDIPGVGRFAVVMDPDGCAFSPFAASPDAPLPDDAEPAAGGVSWNEVFVNDVARGVDFYTTVFGWADDPMDVPGVPEPYHMLKSGETGRAGLMSTQGGMMPPLWVIHFRTDDLDASTKKATDLGGSTFGPVIAVEGIGRFQWIADPQGAQFVLSEQPA